MKNSILFLCTLGLLLALFSCEKDEIVQVADKTAPTQEATAKNGLGQFTSPPTGCPVGDPNSQFRLSPYVEQASPCYNLYHAGFNYETVVYVGAAKPYTRRVTVFGWRNGNRSAIPNTYSVTIPANAYSSNRVSTFGQEPMQYSSILVEVSAVFKQVGSNWVPDTDYRATCASIPVQNCYQEELPCHLTNTCDDDDDNDPPTLF